MLHFVLRPASFLCILLFVMMCSCAGFFETKRLALLEDTSFLYEQALSAGKYRAAYRYIKTNTHAHEPDFRSLDAIKISSYELIDKTSERNAKIAQLTIRIRYFHSHFLIEKTLIDVQQWEYDTDEERWWLTTGLPNFQ